MREKAFARDAVAPARLLEEMRRQQRRCLRCADAAAAARSGRRRALRSGRRADPPRATQSSTRGATPATNRRSAASPASAPAHDLEQLPLRRRPAARSCRRDRRSLPGVSSTPSDGSERIDAVAQSTFTNGCVAPRALPVDRARHRFAAGPALAEHEHVAAARRDAAHQGQHFADGRRRAEHAAGRQFQRRRRLGPRSAAVCANSRALPMAAPQILFADGPGDEIGDAEPQRLRRRVRLASIGDADDRDVGANAHGARRNRSASGRGEIEDDDEVGVRLRRRGWRAPAPPVRACVTVWPRRSSISARPSRSPVSAAIRRTAARARSLHAHLLR